MSRYNQLINKLLKSDSPSVRYKICVGVLDEDPQSKAMRSLAREIKRSTLVAALLSERKRDGTIPCHPYAKWRGAHWVLALLAELNYPPGDRQLLPLRAQVYEWMFSKRTPLVNGLHRSHASQEGNLIHYLIQLGLADKRLDALVANLLTYQWPDGGWNCDRKPAAHTSSFVESAIPLRGLIAYHRVKPSAEVAQAIARAGEFFLQRRLFVRLSNGQVIHADFVKLAYPDFYFYTFLQGLRIMAEAGLIGDVRCQPALDLLESKLITAQGWKTEKRFYHYNGSNPHRYSAVRWTDFTNGRANIFLTVNALTVLKQSGRFR